MAPFIPHRCPKCFESVTLVKPRAIVREDHPYTKLKVQRQARITKIKEAAKAKVKKVDG